LANPTDRAFDAPPDQVFEALRRAVAGSGLQVQGADAQRRVLYFKSGRKSMSATVTSRSDGGSLVRLMGGAPVGLHDQIAAQLASVRQVAKPESAEDRQGGEFAADLQGLAALRERGLLTDEEFADAKARLFSSEGRGSTAPTAAGDEAVTPPTPIARPPESKPTQPVSPPTPVAAGGVSSVDRVKALLWGERSWRGRAAIIGAAVVASIAALALIPTESEDASSTTSTTTTQSVTDESEPAPAPSESSDTGRMSEGEYETFSTAQAEVIDEALQFGEEVQKCAVIGLAGQIAEFSDCMDEAYSGFSEDADYALFIAQDTLDDVAKRCRVRLTNYLAALDNLSEKVAALHRAGSLLQADEITATSNALPGAADRYAKVSVNVLSACSPS
jgi:hypothetical protein